VFFQNIFSKTIFQNSIFDFGFIYISAVSIKIVAMQENQQAISEKKINFSSKRTKHIQNKELNKKNVYLYCINAFKKFKGTGWICSRLRMSIQALNRYLKNLKKLGIIEKKGYATWQITHKFQKQTNKKILNFIDEKKRTKHNFSVGMKKTRTNLHALTIQIPIISGKINLKKDGGYETKLKNWNRQFKRMQNLGVTLANNNNKSLSIYVWSRDIFDPVVIPKICFVAVQSVYQMCKEEGIILDAFGWEVKALHINIRQKDMDDILNKKLKVEVVLSRNAKKITERDMTRKAKAWVDNSPFSGLETDDLGYYENYILMPERVAKLEKMIHTIYTREGERFIGMEKMPNVSRKRKEKTPNYIG